MHLCLGDMSHRALGRMKDTAPEDQRFVQALIERSVGGEVAVSHACGLGRRSPEAAARALERLAELA